MAHKICSALRSLVDVQGVCMCIFFCIFVQLLSGAYCFLYSITSGIIILFLKGLDSKCFAGHTDPAPLIDRRFKKKKKNVCGAPIKPHLQKQAVGQSLPIPNFMFLLAEIMHKLNTKFGFCSIISQYIHCVGTNSHFQNKYYSRIDCTSEFSH